MAFIYNRIVRKLVNNEYGHFSDSNFDGDKSTYEDSSSEDESQPVLPLFDAIEKGRKLNVIIKYLNQHDINAVDVMSNTCLHIAVGAMPYDLSVIKELVKRGAEINQPNWKKNTPLHCAAENPQCDVDLIKVLLDSGANPDSKNFNKDTPLHLLVMRCLLDSNSDKYLEIINFLLENGAQPNIPNSVSITPFLMAVHPPYCHLGACVGLVKFGADFSVSRSNESWLDKSLLPNSSRSLDVMKLLVRYEPRLAKSKDKRRRTPLHVALFGGARVDIVKELINNGADVNARDEECNTPLHRTTLSSYSVIETLVRYGARLDARNRYGNTPLLESVNHKVLLVNPAAIRALIVLGANVRIRDIFRRSALQHALANNKVPTDVVELLLEKGDELIDVTSQNVHREYNFTRNRRIAFLFLQYFLFYKVLGKYLITNEAETFISFHKYGPALCNVFSNFRDNCLSQLLHMKYDYLSDGTDLYYYIRRNLGNFRFKYKYPVILIKEILFRIHTNKYPHCTDLLRACIKRNKLLEYLPLLLVYTTVLDDINSKQSIILDYYSLMNLANYLNQDTLLSLVEAFSDDLPINKRRKPYSTPSCPNIFKSSTKRKHSLLEVKTNAKCA